MKRVVFDIETNDFDPTKLWCAVAIDADTEEKVVLGPSEAHRIVDIINDADEVIGHNIIGFDLPALAVLYERGVVPKLVKPKKVTDTLVLARLLHADIKERDFNRPNMPAKFFGKHSLEAWGYRLGLQKEGLDVSFDHWSQELQDRCVRDTELNLRLLRHLMLGTVISEQAVVIEHRMATIVRHMEKQGGWCFDVSKAVVLAAQLSKEITALEEKLRVAFPPKWHVVAADFVPKVNAPKFGYVAGCPLTKIERMEFNAASREEIAQRLIDKYGWKPTEFSEKTGRPTIDEDVLENLDYPEASDLNRYMLLQKRLGSLSTGREAWLKVCIDTDYGPMIRGRYNQNGAITGRASHYSPNITQVPKLTSPFGHECRELFHAPEGAILIGTDLSGLELRCLAHYVSAFDGGEYARELLQGDIHTKVQKLCDLPTRDNAKTVKYALIYGGGDARLGEIVKGGKARGTEIRNKLMAGLPGLKKVTDEVKREAAKGYVLGLDGRRVSVRAQYKALNTKLQSAGAIIAKQWLINVWIALHKLGLRPGVDFWFACWAHDEVNIVLFKTEMVEEVKAACKAAARKAGEDLKLRVPIDADAKHGRTWADVH